MKRFIASLFAALLVSQAWAYDFSAESSSGHTLYYNITSNTEPYTVEVTYPAWNYDGFTKPSGELIIPETVEFEDKTYSITSISGNAFESCDLVSVSIGNSVKSIGTCAFHTNRQLESFSVSIDNPYFSSEDGVLFNKDKTELVCCPNGKTGDYTIPGTVKKSVLLRSMDAAS